MNWLPRKLANSRLKGIEGSRWNKRSQGSRTVADLGSEGQVYSAANVLQVKTSSCHSRPDLADQQANPGIAHASIILPIYNEQACIQDTFDAVLRYAEAHPTCDFIFVNDGSTDQTVALLEARIAHSKSDRILLISYRQRGGKGYAVRRGVEVADSDFICFLDGDLAYSLDHLDVMLSKLAWVEMVIGCRSLVPGDQQDLKPIRKIAGKVFNLLSRQILNLQYVDMQAGLKGFQKSVAKRLFSMQELTGFSFDVELIYLARKYGFTIAEIPARVSPLHNRKLSKVNLFSDSLMMLKDLLRIRCNDVLGRYE